MLRRSVAVVVVLAAAAGLAAAVWPQGVGLERTIGLAQVVALRGSGIAVALVLAVLLVALGLLARGVRPLAGALAALLVAFAVANGAVLGLRGVGAPGLPDAGANDLTVLSWNTLGDSVPAATLAREARAVHADVVALPETTAPHARAVAKLLRRQGVRMTAHTVALDQIAKARSTSLLIADSLGRYRIETRRGDTGLVPTVVAVPSGGQRAPTILAVHTVAPVPGELTTWRSDLAWVATRCSGGNTVLAGDFNATLDHLTGLGHRPATLGRCRDGALATGNAGVGTWPTMLPALTGAPIDHVMATANWRFTGFRVLTDQDGAGSDHRPVVARLAPAG